MGLIRRQVDDVETLVAQRLDVTRVLFEREIHIRRSFPGGGQPCREASGRRANDGAGESDAAPSRQAAWLRPDFLAICNCCCDFCSRPEGLSLASGIAAHTPTLTLMKRSTAERG